MVVLQVGNAKSSSSSSGSGSSSSSSSCGQKRLDLFGFSTTLRLNPKYLLNGMWHRQSGKGVGTYEGSPTLSQNFMNFVPQTA